MKTLEHVLTRSRQARQPNTRKGGRGARQANGHSKVINEDEADEAEGETEAMQQ